MADSPTTPEKVNGRYEIKNSIGEGGMGVVYRAYDTVTKRYVALKTMRGIVDPAAIELFEREWTVLARLSHPNIVDILDTGDFRDNGQRKPYFVMPLLPGLTLDKLIKDSSQRLTVEKTVEIMCQACRGLQAAHDQGLVHRDLKPSNIFVMEDDTVKIIDFGVVHLVDTRSATGMKGTLQYMAPEQLEMKPATPLSDIFALGVVCYESLTRRKPFSRKTESEVVDAIRTYVPPPASEINPAVNQLVSRTIHKAMAKQPWHRFSSAKEFSETLQKAIRNEPIERFDRTKIQPRIDRIRKAHAEGDYQFATEILTELESEGHIDPEMSLLRIQLERSIRQKNIKQLIESARTRMEEQEFPLALQKIQEVLNIDPGNLDASTLKTQIERQRSEKQVEQWVSLVRQHLDNQFFTQARQGIQEILKINSSDTRARELLAEVDRTEQEAAKIKEEKQKLYEAAVASYKQGEISTALSKLERLLELNRQGPKSVTPERDAQYQSLYNQIRSERDAARNAYAEGRKHLMDRNFPRALEICRENLQKHSGDPMFQALKLEAEELQRQEQSAAVAEINRRMEAEPDLDKKYNIIKQAVDKYPNEQHFQSSLTLVRERRDLINSIVGRARQYEERGQFNDAAGQWDILRNIYPVYPGLDFEIQRLARRRDEQLTVEAKARWVERIDQHLGAGEYTKALEVAKEALRENSGDKELEGLQLLADQAMKRSSEANLLLQEGRAFVATGKQEEGIHALREAHRLDERNSFIRAVLLSAILQHARELIPQDWRQAESLVKEALELDSGDPAARNLASSIEDYKRQEAVGKFVLEARNLQAAGDLSGATRKVEEGLRAYPNELRLSQLYNTLRNAAPKEVAPEPLTGTEFLDRPTVILPVPPPQPAPVVPSEPRPPALGGWKTTPVLWLAVAAVAILVVVGALLVRHLHGPNPPTSKHKTVPKTPQRPPSKPIPPAAAAPPELHITSDLKPGAGKFALDDNPPADLQQGSLVKNDISPGNHTLKILDNNRSVFSFAFDMEPNKLPAVTAAPVGASPGVVVASLGGSAKVYASAKVRGALEGQPPQLIPPEGLDVSLPAQGSVQFMVDDGNGKSHAVSIDSSPLAALSVTLSGAPERVPVIITANVSDANVIIDDRQLKRTMINGLIPVRLPPGKYRIQVTHDGYEPPQEQLLEIKSGDTKVQPLSFSLTPIRRDASLAIQSAPAGANVFIDGTYAGAVGSNGAFTTKVNPGNHTITLKKAFFDDLKIERDFKAGETAAVNPAMKAYGFLALKVMPANARVTYHGGTETQEIERSNNATYQLPPGDYVITAEASGYSPSSATYTVSPGKSVTVDLDLKPIPRAPITTLTAEIVFENGSSWKTESHWWIHDAKGLSFFRARQGSFIIDIQKGTSKAFIKSKVKKVTFFADYKDPANRIAYTLDAHNLVKKVFVYGHASEESKIDHGMEGLSAYRLRVEITPSTIIIKNSAGTVLDVVRGTT
ncbi:MAG: protein kinase, partial [Bryobacteraceae bacterium]